MKSLVLYSSSRRGGNSDLLTDRLVEGMGSTKVYLDQLRIEPVVDRRHVPSGFTPVDDDYDGLIAQVLDHDLLIFACPLYWYGMPSPLKAFFDRWSQSLRDQRFDFRQALASKRAAVVITGSDRPRIKGLPLVQQFEYIFGFAGLPFLGYVIGEGNKPGEVLNDERALAEVTALRRQFSAQ